MTLVEFLHPIRTGKQRSLVLAVLYFFKATEAKQGMTAAEIKNALMRAKIPKAKDMNVNAVLGAASPYVHAPAGYEKGVLIYELTATGDQEVQKILNLPPPSTTTQQDAGTLQTLAEKLTDEVVRGFIEEAIICLENNALRAAIVFVWSGAIRTLHEKALAEGEAAVNAAIVKQYPKAPQIKKIEDFAWIRDRTFLDASVDIGILDKGQQGTMVEALNLRNRCGHPTQYRPGIEKARSYIEDVVGIVFS